MSVGWKVSVTFVANRSRFHARPMMKYIMPSALLYTMAAAAGQPMSTTSNVLPTLAEISVITPLSCPQRIPRIRLNAVRPTAM